MIDVVDEQQGRVLDTSKKLNIKVLPANGGDSLLVSFAEENNIKNILIDGGIGATYKKSMKTI